MKKILIITDAWEPQVNGVVTTMTTVVKKLEEKNFNIINLDINIIAEKPKITKYVTKMINKISKLLKIKISIIAIKATTNEKIGFIGNGEGIAAESIIHISDDKTN